MPKYSNCLSVLTTSKIREFYNLAKTKNAKYMLSLGDTELHTASPIIQSAISALQSGQTHYSDNQGSFELRKKLSDLENMHFSANYSPNEILITHGATQALSCAIQACLNPLDEVLIILPSYPLYKQLVHLSQGICHYIKPVLNHFKVTKQLLEKNYTPSSKLLIINHPQNPTGHVYSKQEMEIIEDFVLAHDLFLIVDECYVNLQYQETPISFSSCQALHNQMLICRTFSKDYAMSGWRIGYLLGNSTAIKHCTKIHQATLSCISPFIQQAAITALHQQPLNQHYQNKAHKVYTYLKEVFPITPLEAGLYYFLPIHSYSTSSEAFCIELLNNCSISLIPGTAFDYEGYVRLSICMEDSLLIEALEVLQQYLKRRVLSP